MVRVLRIDPYAGVVHRDRYSFRISNRGLDGQQPPAANGPHGLDCIHDQIQEHLLQLYPVTQDAWEAGGKVSL